MASVHLLSAAPSMESGPSEPHRDLDQMRSIAALDRIGAHRVVADPAAADLILFVETSTGAGPYFELVRRHPIYRAHRERCYLFSSTDRLVPFLPGVFASIERRWYWPAWTRAGHYLGVRERPGLRYEPDAPVELLFSFVGATANHPVRRRVAALRHPEAFILDVGAEAESVARGVRPALDDAERTARFVRSIRESAFVLCPRGGGTSTFRLFEAMMLGRAPVVISDRLVLPRGPRWEDFSLRVAEKDVGRIPALLEARRADAAAMGETARREWLEWFSPEVGFHRTVELCLELAAAAPARRGARRYVPYLQMLRPYHAARRLRWAVRRG